MAEVSTDARTGPRSSPLSPHLGIYRWTITMAVSILHRLTGLVLGAGTLLLAWWLLALAQGPQSFDVVQTFIGSILGRLVLFAFTWALTFHALNGIRHLVWDLGFGFELPNARRSGWLVVALSLVLTLGLWVMGYGAMEHQP